ncbi:MAG: toll/interleukin-1 receptor domain-containing protein [Caenispirillum sp.]|nr:toll/interleukin-1 receptor domain-containing protein [Caenispirillum sp.]
MLPGFDTKIDGNFLNELMGENAASTETSYSKMAEEIKNKLDLYIGPDGSLDAKKIQKDWFPQTKCDVFISHAHADNKIALKFASWLERNFKITSFVDSAIWRHCNNLLNALNVRYSKNATSSYDYDKVKIMSSHVYIMLTVSIMMMMSRTRCVFFLNTPHSLSASDAINSSRRGETSSPWIYAELAMSRLLEQRPEEKRMVIAKEEFKFNYTADREHFEPLDGETLLLWKRKAKNVIGLKAIDILYSICDEKRGDKSL